MIQGNIAQSFGLLNAHLLDKDWIAGDFTGADVQAYFAVKALQSRGGLGRWDSLKAWLVRCENRSAYRQAVEQGGKIFE